MALQNSGQITLGEIAAEYGGNEPHQLSEYYDAAQGVPASGEIQIGADFYGTQDFDPNAPGHTYTNTGSGSWSYNIPDGATNMRLEMVGGGGGGGTSSYADGAGPGQHGNATNASLSGTGSWQANGGTRGSGGHSNGGQAGGPGGNSSGPGINTTYSQGGNTGNGGHNGPPGNGGTINNGNRSTPPFSGQGHGGAGGRGGGGGGTGGYMDTGFDALPTGTGRSISGNIGTGGAGDCTIRDGCASGGSNGAVYITFT